MTAAPDDLILTVVKSGAVSVGESTYSISTSSSPCSREARERYLNQGVVIRGDASLSYQGLADVLSACDEAGIRNVRLPVRTRDEQTKPPDRPPNQARVDPRQGWTVFTERGWILQQDRIDCVQFVQTIMHLDPESLNEYAESLGPWLYVVLFGIIFAETGLVVTPFLPGDSLLFAVGAVAAHRILRSNLGLVAVLAGRGGGAGRRRQLL